MRRDLFVTLGLVILSTLQAAAQNAPVTINVDASLNRHPISPDIYGVAYATTAQLQDLNVFLNRSGGNNTSRYNWNINADNRGSDWYFESIGDASSVAGERGDTFIANAKAASAQAMLTIPMVGWVAKLGPNRSYLASYLISKYGAQTGKDPYWPDAGNGVSSITGQYITGNDANDANVPADSLFQQAWVQHLVGKWGTAQNGGLRYYILDNEPSIWHATHHDVHPVGATMDEIKNKILDYAAKIKAVDPTALVVGPEEWGWSGYFYSGYDQQYGNQYGWGYLPDRANHNNWDYVPWLLDQIRQNDAATGKRSLDVFSLHYYPQSGEFYGDDSAGMQALRNRSTRSLWDPSYVDQSWIGSVVQLIPRMKSWVNAYYPGTKTAITEYNWGDEWQMNGATTQADIWGIFGREGLDMAARWTTPDPGGPTYKAMKMYRNYDGNKSTFGDASVSAAVPNPDNLSAFAAMRTSDGAMTVMVINKIAGTTPVTLNLANFAAAGTAQAWQLATDDPNVQAQITRLPDVALSGSTLATTVHSQSVTLLVIPTAVGTVQARVLDRNRQPLSGAEVHLFDLDKKVFIGQTAAAAADGSVTIPNVPIGRYHIGAYKAGYNAWIFSPNFQGWQVAGGQTVGPVDIVLDQTGTLAGSVFGYVRYDDSTGAHPIGSGVHIDVYSGGHLVASTDSNPNGQYSVGGLNAINNWWGWYTYIATWNGHTAAGVNFGTWAGVPIRMDIAFKL